MGNNFEYNNDWGTAWAQHCVKWLEGSRCCWRCHSPNVGTAGIDYTWSDNFICKGTVTFESVEGEKGWQSLFDVDYIVHINCAGCPLLEAGEEVEVTQYHEFKANRQTHEELKTQNLAIETRENWQNYNGNKFGTVGDNGYFKPGRWEINPITGDREQIRQGAGWWIKREELKREGREGIVTDDAHKIADWYHFIQMFEEDDTMEVSDNTAAAFMEDDTLPPGAALLRYYPLPYVVSVTGGYLRSLIEQKKYTVKSLGVNARGYRIPVSDIVPSQLFEKTRNEEGQKVYSYLANTGLIYGEARVKVHLISDFERRWERNTKGKWVEKGNAKPISPLKKKDREHKTEKVYVPREFRDSLFEVHTLNAAPAMYKQIKEFVDMLGLNVDLEGAQMMIVKPNETFAASQRGGEIEQLGFFTDMLVYRWSDIYPPDEGI